MRRILAGLVATGFAAVVFSLAVAQGPGDRPRDKRGRGDGDGPSLVDRLMKFNKKKDGKLTKEEITDERLHRLFDMADVNKDGVVTRAELEALALNLEDGNEGPGDRGPGGKGKGKKGKGRRPGGPPPGDEDRPGERGPGDRGPFGRGPGGPPRPGTILPPHLVEMLELTADQRKQLESLQKDVNGKLGKILNAEQKKQLDEFRPPRGPGFRGPGDRGPGGRGPGDRGPGGRGPGGPPPDDA